MFFWGVVVRLQRHERQHGWTCPQPPGAECGGDQGDSAGAVSASAFFFLLTAWRGAVGCTQRACAAPQPTPTREGGF